MPTGLASPSGGKNRGEYQWAGGVASGTENGVPYIALNHIPEGIYRKKDHDWAPEVRAPKIQVCSSLGIPKSVSFTFSGTVRGSGYTLGNGRGTGTITIPGLPYARMTTSNVDGCSASYSNGTLTVRLNKGTGEVTGSGNVSKTVNWSITCTFYLI